MTKYSLVLDTIPMSFALETEISLEEAKKAHKKWMAKIKRSEWVTLPVDLPVYMNTKAFIALRVVEITPQERAVSQAEKNPAAQRLFQGAQQFGGDNTDMGYK